MRLEHLYGEESPEPTKRTDTSKSKPKSKKKDEELEENIKKNLVFASCLYLFLAFVGGFIKGMGGCDKVTKVY
jgi:hypothetical protein